MKMILKLLLLPDVWHGVIDLNNIKRLRKISATSTCSMASTKWWGWCMPEDEKKETEPLLIDVK